MKKLLLLAILLLLGTSSFAQVASSAPEVDKKLPRFVDFGSKQCNACKTMEPMLLRCVINHADKFITEFVDVWQPENQALARENNIQTIPTQIYFDAEGKELFRHTGLVSEKDILAKWADLGFTFKEKQPLTESQE